jgi:effector-binding domain-containing protein
MVRENNLETKELFVRIERLTAMPAAYACSFAATPEEEAMKKIKEWAKNQGLLERAGARLFGRNTYPTDKPASRGYELYLTTSMEPTNFCDIETAEIPSGLYAVLRFKSLENMQFGWKKLWNWIEASGYEHAGWQRGKYGWVNGFEEQVNWQEDKPPTEWLFDLWVPLKE